MPSPQLPTKKSETPTYLELVDREISDEAIPDIIQELRTKNIIFLNLSNNAITLAGLSALAKEITHCKNLLVVRLNNNNFNIEKPATTLALEKINQQIRANQQDFLKSLDDQLKEGKREYLYEDDNSRLEAIRRKLELLTQKLVLKAEVKEQLEEQLDQCNLSEYDCLVKKEPQTALARLQTARFFKPKAQEIANIKKEAIEFGHKFKLQKQVPEEDASTRAFKTLPLDAWRLIFRYFTQREWLAFALISKTIFMYFSQKELIYARTVDKEWQGITGEKNLTLIEALVYITNQYRRTVAAEKGLIESKSASLAEMRAKHYRSFYGCDGSLPQECYIPPLIGGGAAVVPGFIDSLFLCVFGCGDPCTFWMAIATAALCLTSCSISVVPSRLCRTWDLDKIVAAEQELQQLELKYNKNQQPPKQPSSKNEPAEKPTDRTPLIRRRT